ncbi:hypothetical protein GCM10023149_10550 [Mucilaginibacter gynuensis]|uniref:Gliding motility-associated C-terminal domain-containing protein n=2 Tax=Mucilaginibacter gynuensis TaxID=1302236 RepID=A0ABP8FZU1_9SPHI
MLFIPRAGMAQLCTGSLGDPVRKIDFGAGSATHSGALGSAFTSYTYSSADFPTDGSYTIENTTAGSGSVWWSTTDHTGDSGGYMMVVNASFTKTDYFYKAQITGLCPGTTYEFSAWVVNLLRSNDISPPDLTFSILKNDGSVIKTQATGTVPRTSGGPVWVQKGFYFTMPNDVADITIQITNNSNGGAPANDLGLDDITFRPCGPVMQASFSNTSAVTTLAACANTNQTYTLSADVSTGYINPAYQWQVNSGSGYTDIPGATAKTYTVKFEPAIAGIYRYRLASAEATNIGSASCQVVSNELTLNIEVAPESVATVSSPVCEGSPLTLSASSGTTYAWTGPNGFTSALQNPTIQQATTANSGDYEVTVTSSSGCKSTAQVSVLVNPSVTAVLSGDATICEGDNTPLSASGGTSYLWSPVTGLSDATVANPTANPTDNTTYTVMVSNSSGCSATGTVTVNVLKKAGAQAGADLEMMEGQSVTLNGKATGTNVTWFWTPATYLSSTTALNPVADPQSDITYTLHVISADGCGIATDDVNVRVYKKVIVPNTFSPNGDGVNDTWTVTALDTYPASQTRIFNRYGQMLFNSTGYTKAWDGRYMGQPVPAGTYYYVIDVKPGEKLSGWVLVVR